MNSSSGLQYVKQLCAMEYINIELQIANKWGLTTFCLFKNVVVFFLTRQFLGLIFCMLLLIINATEIRNIIVVIKNKNLCIEETAGTIVKVIVSFS